MVAKKVVKAQPKASTIRDSIGTKFKELTDKGITVYRIAKESGVHRGILWRYLRGECDMGTESASQIIAAMDRIEATQ